MRQAIVPLILTLALLGCADAPERPNPNPVTTEAPPAPPPVQMATNADQCGAKTHQNLVGKSRYEIPVPVYPALQRVACTSCPVTMDFSPRRLNFFYDAETGLIKEVKCG